MATTTTNFGWDIPQSTDLVKDGATAIAALGQDIDTAFIDLKGGTTGQVLAKASGTDLDFSWVAQDDSNAIQNTQLTAKGSLISAFSAGTPATLTVGTNGQVLAADSAEATGLKWTTPASGLTLVKTQTIGSAVSSVTVTSAFSSTYDNYRITVTGGVASANNVLNLTLGSTVTGYYRFQINCLYTSSTVGGSNGSNTASFYGSGLGSVNSITADFELQSPNLAKNTHWRGFAAGSSTNNEIYWNQGYLADTTAYTAFTLTTTTGTLTGGTIRVYGYQNS
jgi:hypothetical protein